MSRGAVCVILLIITVVAEFSSAGFIHANQTVHLELSSRPAKRGTAISCNDATVEQLEDKLLAHLNDYNKTIANGTTCEFLPAGSASCKSSGIKFKIVLACAGDRANGNLIDNDSKQKMAITNIMQRRTSESFTAHDVEIIVRLFRDSDRRNSPKPTCNKECSEVEQGPLILCDCPSIDVPKPSCNIPAVLVRITKDKSIGQTSCDQVDPSTHSFDQQIKSLLRTQSYGGLQLQLATNDVKSSSNCTTVNGQVQLSMLTSITVTVETPHCGDNISCIQQFNAKQLDTTESFFNYILPFLIGSDSDAEVTLWCSNGTMLTSDGQCCAPGCDMCEDREPVDLVLAVNFNVSQLSAVSCSQLNFTQVNITMIRQLMSGANLVRQAGGKLLRCGYPTVNCTEMDGRVNSIVASILLELTLAPSVVANSEAELIEQIDGYIRGLIEGAEALVGDGNNVVTAQSYAVEITNGTTECLSTPEHCPAGSYLNDESCQPCPIGQYTDKPGQPTCLHCPDGQNTNLEGATSINDCIDIPKPCPKGHYSINGFLPCTACLVGFYQGRTGQTSCIKCPSGYSTVNNGSTGLLNCSVVSTTSTPIPTVPTVRTYPAVVPGSYFTSPNYPNNYPVLEKRSYQLICTNSSHSVGLFVLDLSLADGDSLIIHNERYDGPVAVTIPEPKMYSSQSITVTFVSDGSNTGRGFRVVHGCYITNYAVIVRRLSIDCDVRKHIKNNDRAIDKLLKVMSGELSFDVISTDPDLAPVHAVIQSGEKPC